MKNARISLGRVNLRATISPALRVYSLPPHHRDPFDRLLVAQCLAENLPLLSDDQLIASSADR